MKAFQYKLLFLALMSCLLFVRCYEDTLYNPEQYYPRIAAISAAVFTTLPDTALPPDSLLLLAADSVSVSIDDTLYFIGGPLHDSTAQGIFGWEWDDSSSAEWVDPFEIVSHCFADSGAYSVAFVFQDIGGNADTVFLHIEVTDRKPVIRLDSIPPVIDIESDILFSAQVEDDGRVESYMWNFNHPAAVYNQADSLDSLPDRTGMETPGDTDYDTILSTNVPLWHRYHSPGIPQDSIRYAVVFTVKDDDNHIVSDTAALTVMLHIPVAAAGNDTTVTIGDPVILNASASTHYFPVLTYGWQVGEFNSVKSEPIHTAAFTAPGTYRCILTVHDSIGNVSVPDTAVVSVINSMPRIKLDTDSMLVRKGSECTITFAVSDSFGTIDGVVFSQLYPALWDSVMDCAARCIWTGSLSAPGQHLFRIIAADEDGNMVSDSVAVYVNSPPDSVVLVSPADYSKNQPLTPLLQWRAWDRDYYDAEHLRYTVVLSYGETPADTVLDNEPLGLDSASYQIEKPFANRDTVRWFVVATDSAGESVQSKTGRFSVVDMTIVTGECAGYALKEGVHNHDSIAISLQSSSQDTHFTTMTGQNGYFHFAKIEPGEYTLTGTGPAGYSHVSKEVTIIIRDSVFCDTLLLADTIPPSVSCSAPEEGDTIIELPQRTLVVKGSFQETGSGIVPDSTTVLLNGQPAVLSINTETRWELNIENSADGHYHLVITTADSAGNRSAPMHRYFTVNAKQCTFTVDKQKVSIGDTLTFTLATRNINPPLSRLYIDYTGRDDGVWDDSVDSPAGQTVFRWSSSEPVESGECIVSVVDDSCMGKTVSLAYEIVRDVPVVDAGSDTDVVINTEVTLDGSATQQFGTITMYLWDFDGDGVYDDSSESAPAMSYIYTEETEYNATLAVRDDDGNVGVDSRTVSAVNHAPRIVSIRNDTTVSVFDQIPFGGEAEDSDGAVERYEWDFDDDGGYDYSSTASAETVFTYLSQGVFSARLRVSDDGGKQSDSTVEVTVLLDPPVVDAGVDTTVVINTPVTFAAAWEQQFGTVTMVKWDFEGDGEWDDSSSNSNQSTHLYESEEVYQLGVLVRDDDGNEGEDSRTVTVSNSAPVIVSTNPDTTVSVYDEVNFRAEVTDPDGSVVEYTWDYGDGSALDISTLDATRVHTYDNEGEYTATLSVTDDAGKHSSHSISISVIVDPPSADAGEDMTVVMGETVALQGSGTDTYGTIEKFEWKIGEGDFTGSADGEMSFTAPEEFHPSYRCILRVTDDDWNTALDTVSITVGSAWQPLGSQSTVSDGAANYTTLFCYGVTPWAGYQDNTAGDRATIKRYDDDGVWETQGGGGFTPSPVEEIVFTVFDYQESFTAYMNADKFNRLSVMRYNDDYSYSWEFVGDTCITASGVTNIAIASLGSTPYVAFRDRDNGSTATVLGYISSSWSTIGSSLSDGAADEIGLVSDNGALYLCFCDNIDFKPTVKKYESSSWTTIGSARFTAGQARSVVMDVEGGNVWVAFKDNSNSGKVTVMSNDGAGWSVVGAPGFSGASTDIIALAVYNSRPYVAFKDGTAGGKATVMNPDLLSGEWVAVGNAGISSSEVYALDIAVRNGEITLACQNSGNQVEVINFR
jgi:PKD repeat protein